MRFLIDMGLDVRVAQWLRTQGHDAKHLRDEGLQRLPDSEIFAKAVEEARTILTCDLDFTEIVALTRGRLASIIVFRLRNARAVRVIDRLASVLPQAGSALDRGAVVTVEETRHRIRGYPVRRLPDRGA